MIWDGIVWLEYFLLPNYASTDRHPAGIAIGKVRVPSPLEKLQLEVICGSSHARHLREAASKAPALEHHPAHRDS